MRSAEPAGGTRRGGVAALAGHEVNRALGSLRVMHPARRPRSMRHPGPTDRRRQGPFWTPRRCADQRRRDTSGDHCEHDGRRVAVRVRKRLPRHCPARSGSRGRSWLARKHAPVSRLSSIDNVALTRFTGGGSDSGGSTAYMEEDPPRPPGGAVDPANPVVSLEAERRFRPREGRPRLSLSDKAEGLRDSLRSTNHCGGHDRRWRAGRSAAGWGRPAGVRM